MTDTPRTVLVRILVAVDRDGCWTAQGNGTGDDCDHRPALEMQTFEVPIAYHWIEADVPVPSVDAVAIAGTVTPERWPLVEPVIHPTREEREWSAAFVAPSPDYLDPAP